MDDYLILTYEQLAVAAFLLCAVAVLTILLRLRIAKHLLWSASRMIAQLTLVGMALRWLFEVNHWLFVAALVFTMTTIAGTGAGRRIKNRSRSTDHACLWSTFASSWCVLLVTVTCVLKVSPWYDSRFIIPLLGMILGNTMTAVAIAVDRAIAEMIRSRDLIETCLALGGQPNEVTKDSFRDAVHAGLIPIINQMSVAGIVTLPGMMTGQVLAGIDPVEAVKYQIVIMVLLAASSTLATVIAVWFLIRAAFTPAQQLRESLLNTDVAEP